MPRKAKEISPVHLKEIKLKIIEKYKNQILRSVDCDRLAEDISGKTNTYINGITFKRLFGFTKYPFNPSIQTLDILSQYVGFTNWYDFLNSLAEAKPISSHELDILVSFYDFDFINKIEYHDGGIQSISRKIALRFRQDPMAFKQVVKQLAQKKYAQIFFIEHFPDYDNLCTYYYLIYEEYLKQKNTLEAQIFGNCILFLKSFWLMKKEDCQKYITEINKYSINDELHPYVIGRYYACNMLYKYYYGNKKDVKSLYSNFLECNANMHIGKNHFRDFPASEYIISEALLHCKMYKECIELIENTFPKYNFKMEFVRKGYYRQMQLFLAESYYSIGKTNDSIDLYRKINPGTFYFISKDYYTILYLALGLQLNFKESNYLKSIELAEQMNNQFLLKKLKSLNVSTPI